MPASLADPLVRDGRTLMPLDVVPWLRFLAGMDFSFGSRIHGNIAAVLAGTPAFVLAHDSRTTELAEYHRLPYRVLNGRLGEVDAERLYDLRCPWRRLLKRPVAGLRRLGARGEE